MNNILDEITYCDGRMEDRSSVAFIDTPAKLKLREETNKNIHRSLNARRGPKVKSSTFTIPVAAMAMPLPGDPAEGGAVNAPVQNNNLAPSVRMSDLDGSISKIAEGKKLRTSTLQAATFHSRWLKEKGPSVAPSPVNNQVPIEEVIPTVSNVIPEVKAPEAVNAIPTVTPPVEAPQMTMPQEAAPQTVTMPTITPEEPKAMDIDAVRQKAYEQPPVATTPETPNVEIEEQIDSFKELQKVTEEYNVISQEMAKTETKLKEEQDTLTARQDEFRGIQEAMDQKQEEMNNHQAAIDDASKETERIEKEHEKVKRKMERNIALTQKAKERKLQEKRRLDEEVQKVQKESEEVKQQIEDNKKVLAEMNEKVINFAQKETDALERKRKAQEELRNSLDVLKAITLPPEVEEEMEREEEGPVLMKKAA